jgi:hypothetical protein
MRKLLISILLASAAAAPAFAAQDRDNERRPEWGAERQVRQQAREERSQAREERQQAREQARAERPQEARPERPQEARAERPQEARAERPAPPPEARQQVQETRGNVDRPRFERSDRGLAQRYQRPDRGDVSNGESINAERQVRSGGFTGDRREQAARQRGDWNRGDREDRAGRGDWRGGGGDLRQSTRPVPNVMRTRNPLVVSDRPREGTQPPLRTEQRRWASSNWNTNWRNDGRHDWRRYRDRNRSRFHIGIYYDPFGWGYRQYQIGWRLWPSYYGRQYWIDDPYQYRLPYTPPGTVWVRYWDDALLVDTWSGEVIDVIHNFFW